MTKKKEKEKKADTDKATHQDCSLKNIQNCNICHLFLSLHNEEILQVVSFLAGQLWRFSSSSLKILNLVWGRGFEAWESVCFTIASFII